MSTPATLTDLLQSFAEETSGVEACVLVTRDGVVLGGAPSTRPSDGPLALGGAGLLNMGTRGASDLHRGPLRHVVVHGDDGYAVLVPGPRGTFLLTTASADARLGVLLLGVKHLVTEARKLL